MENSLYAIIDNPFVPAESRTEALRQILESGFLTFGSQHPTFRIDLHLHTNSSDGFWTPTGLVLESYRKGMTAIALTDHDCFVGIDESFSALKVAYANAPCSWQEAMHENTHS